MEYNRNTNAVVNSQKQIVEDNCNCAGVFMVREIKDGVDILLVESKRKNFQFSFPKGKRDKGEATLDTAKRELYEETGLVETDYELYPQTFYIEYRSDTNKPHIVYYMAKLTNKDAKIEPIDVKEIVSADWYTPDRIYGMRKSFYLQRRQITTRAVKDFKRKSENVSRTSNATTDARILSIAS